MNQYQRLSQNEENVMPNGNLQTQPVAFRFSRIIKSRRLDLQDSVARDHLANERTFLAWVRTGVALAGLGIIISRLSLMGSAGNQMSPSETTFYKSMAMVFILVGIFTILIGLYRFLNVEISMERGYYPTGGIGGNALGLTVILAFLAIFIQMIL